MKALLIYRSGAIRFENIAEPLHLVRVFESEPLKYEHPTAQAAFSIKTFRRMCNTQAYMVYEEAS